MLYLAFPRGTAYLSKHIETIRPYEGPKNDDHSSTTMLTNDTRLVARTELTKHFSDLSFYNPPLFFPNLQKTGQHGGPTKPSRKQSQAESFIPIAYRPTSTQGSDADYRGQFYNAGYVEASVCTPYKIVELPHARSLLLDEYKDMLQADLVSFSSRTLFLV